MSKVPSPNPRILKLHPYKPGMSIEELAKRYELVPDEILKLGSNENSFGPSKKVTTALKNELPNANLYPDPHKLRDRLAEKYDVHSSNIILGNGSNDILDLVARVYLGEGTEAICCQYGFIIFRLLTHLAGARNVVIPASNYGHDLEAMRASITDKTKVIWLANPNNPTGTFVAYGKIKKFLDSVPSEVIVVLDEAYFEYLPVKDSVNPIPWLKNYPNLVISRTFSKIYGLAGLRIGYGVASEEIVELLNRARQAFNVNRLALVGAEAALKDIAYVSECAAANQVGIKQMEAGLKELGISYIKSYANFVTFFIDSPQQVADQLLQQGIIVRTLAEYGLNSSLRMTIGTPAQNDKVLKALAKIKS